VLGKVQPFKSLKTKGKGEKGIKNKGEGWERGLQTVQKEAGNEKRQTLNLKKIAASEELRGGNLNPVPETRGVSER